MKNPETTTKIIIHGTELTFKTDDPAYIRELARFVEEQIQKVESLGNVKSPTKAVTLAAFNIADELFRMQKEKSEMSENLSERLGAMLQMTEETYRSTKLPEGRIQNHP